MKYYTFNCSSKWVCRFEPYGPVLNSTFKHTCTLTYNLDFGTLFHKPMALDSESRTDTVPANCKRTSYPEMKAWSADLELWGSQHLSKSRWYLYRVPTTSLRICVLDSNQLRQLQNQTSHLDKSTRRIPKHVDIECSAASQTTAMPASPVKQTIPMTAFARLKEDQTVVVAP